ncbi:hypothetical protein IAD21_06295 [Abditibacteriota bacterium]|nr:hypothetical protein IAD21_06295 [Abditibacteriota bacterium]
MLTDFNSFDVAPEIPEEVPTGDELVNEVPQSTEVIDGQEVVVIGDVDGTADFSHLQGDNPFGYQGTCGLCSCENILDSFGIQVSEADVVGFAIENDLCFEGDVLNGDDPGMLGGTTEEGQAQILTDLGVPAHAETGGTLEDLAANIENGHGVIAEVDAGTIWNDPNSSGNGQANHAIVVSGVARDPSTGEIEGFFVNDSGTGEAGKFYDAATFEQAWTETGGNSVVTDVVHA